MIIFTPVWFCQPYRSTAKNGNSIYHTGGNSVYHYLRKTVYHYQGNSVYHFQTSRMKHQFIDQCHAMKVSRSGYYDWCRGEESRRSRDNARLLFDIRRIHSKNHGVYGSLRITAELKSKGIRCNHKRVARLMRENGIRSRTRRKFKLTTHSKHSFPVAPNLIQGRFSADKVNRLW